MNALDPKALETATEAVEDYMHLVVLGLKPGSDELASKAVSAYLAATTGRETRQAVTMWAEVVETYEGDGLEWRCHEESGRDSDERPVIELAANTFPLGTKLEISEPRALASNGDGDE